MAVTFALSPLAFEQLYSMLSEQAADLRLQARLDLIDREREWLLEMSRGYRHLWEYRVAYCTDADELYAGLEPDHGALASWLLSTGSGSSSEFSRQLASRTRQSLEAAVAKGRPEPVTIHRPAVVAWTLGSVPGEYDRELPVAFAQDATDLNVRLAYEGLVTHLLDIGQRPEPWSEIATSAVLWRCGGLAEGLAPQSTQNLASSINELMAAARAVMPDSMWRDVNAHWNGFRLARNALTHLTGRAGEPCFADVSTQSTGREHLHNTLTGATHFVANSIRRSMTNPDSDLGRQRMAAAIQEEFGYLTELVPAP